MMLSNARWGAGLTGLAILISTTTAQATMVLPVGLEQMTSESQVIAHARVLDQRVQWSPDKARILTLTTIEVLSPVKNCVKGERRVIYQVGGTLDGVTIKIPGALRFAPGEEIIFFAMRFRDTWVSYGMGLGKYVVRTYGGKRMVTPEFGDVSFVKRDKYGRVVAAARPDDSAQLFDAFMARLAALVAGQGGGQ